MHPTDVEVLELQQAYSSMIGSVKNRAWLDRPEHRPIVVDKVSVRSDGHLSPMELSNRDAERYGSSHDIAGKATRAMPSDLSETAYERGYSGIYW